MLKNVQKTRVFPAYYGKNSTNAGYNTRKVSYSWSTFPAGFEETWALGAYASARNGCNSTLYTPSFWGWEYLSGVTGDKSRFNDVYHRRFGLSNKPHLIHYESSSPKYYNSANYTRSVWPPDAMLAQANETHLDTLHQRCIVTPLMRNEAWANMSPRFQSDANLMLTLCELKDFKDIADALFKGGGRSLFNTMDANVDLIKKSMNRIITFIDRDFRKKHATGLLKDGEVNMLDVISAIDPSKAVAGAWLTYQLAIRPTMMDFTNIMDALKTTVLEAQAKFKTAGEDEQTSHYSVVLDSIDERTVCTPTNADWASCGTIAKCKWTATLKYKYDYRLRDATAGLAKYWGLYMTPETAWNVIPFSFIADYVLTIGRSLRAMERDPNVDILAMDYGESKKTSYSHGYSVSETFRNLCMVIDEQYYIDPKKVKNQHISGVEGTIYEREKREPGKGVVLPRTKLPNTRQTLNLLALARCFL